MGHDKYGLDWSVWGDTAKKPETKGSNPSDTIGKGWGDSPKNTTEDDSGNEPDKTAQPKKVTCTLRNARFIPDETTDFNKSCKITVDVEGTPEGAISFALWAKYKDEEYDLQEVNTAFVKDGKAQIELKLYYVEKYYDDVNCNEEMDATVEYYAKVSNKAAREIKSEVLEMPVTQNGIAIELYEYTRITSLTDLRDKNKITPQFFQKLLDGNTLQNSTTTNTNQVLLNDKWIYIFRKSSKTASLVYELKAAVQGEAQEFDHVSWKSENAEANRNTFPRKTTGTKLQKLELIPEKEYYILVSQMQLPLHRIDFYTQNTDKIRARAANVNIQQQKGNTPQKITCIDFIGSCFEMVEEKNRVVSLFNQYFSNESENSKRYCATMVAAIEKNRPEIKKWLDYDAVTRYLSKEELRTERVKRAKENAFGRLKDWKLSEGYKLARDDYNGTEELEKKIIEIESVVTSEDELEYLAEIGKDQGNWYYRVFQEENAFLFYRKFANLGAYDELTDVLCKWFIGRILEQFPKTSAQIVFDARKYIDLQMKIIGDFEETLSRIKIKIPELSRVDGNLFYVKKDMRYPKIRYNLKDVPSSRSQADYIAGTAEYERAMGEWRRGVENVSDVCRPILLFVEILNLLGSVGAATQNIKNKSTSIEFDLINVTGSLADLLSATDFLLKKKLMEKFGEATYTKIPAGVNLIGSICDYIGALKNISIASYKGQTGLAFAHSVFGLAVGAGAIASTATLSGGTAAAFGVALTPTIITGIGFVAVLFSFVGAGLILIFTEEELEGWAKESEWSKYPQRKKPLLEQARNLNAILCRFRAECYILRQISGTVMTSHGTFKNYLNELRFQIIPGMFYAQASRFKIALQVSDDDGLLLSQIYGKEVILQKTFEMPDSKTIAAPATEKVPRSFRRYFSKEDFISLPDFQYDKLVYKCRILLDLNGDGKELYPQKPLEIKGRVQPRMRDDGQI